jgi:SAM-dependent methyltransferase
MVIGESFAWGHLAKTAGDATLAYFRMFPELVLSADDFKSPDKHSAFRDRQSAVRGKLIALNIRRLPSWILSWAHHERTYLQDAGSPQSMKDLVRRMAETPIADQNLRPFIDRGQFLVGRWLRADRLAEDFLAFIEQFTTVSASQRRRVLTLSKINALEYDHDVHHWLSESQIEAMYKANPIWQAAEHDVYGDTLLRPAQIRPRRRQERRDDPPIPPEYMLSILNLGPADEFRRVGQKYLGYLKELCELKPDHSVLDIGCGLGRVSIPLAAYLTQQARYEGFDVVAGVVEWCQKAITPRFSRFNFQFADVINGEFNPRGQRRASEFDFPFEDQEFDVVYAGFTFSHMLPDDLENYISETSRVLRKGGRFLATFYLLDEVSRASIRRGTALHPFLHERESFSSEREDVPEARLAHEEKFVLSLYERHRLRLRCPIRYGRWSGRGSSVDDPGPDLVVAEPA